MIFSYLIYDEENSFSEFSLNNNNPANEKEIDTNQISINISEIKFSYHKIKKEIDLYKERSTKCSTQSFLKLESIKNIKNYSYENEDINNLFISGVEFEKQKNYFEFEKLKIKKKISLQTKNKYIKKNQVEFTEYDLNESIDILSEKNEEEKIFKNGEYDCNNENKYNTSIQIDSNFHDYDCDNINEHKNKMQRSILDTLIQKTKKLQK
jgi:hypothetical protein